MKRFGLLALLIFGVALIGCSDDDDNPVDCADNDGDGVSAGADCEGDIDCDDEDDTVWQELMGYPDADGDGTATDASEVVCAGESLPDGYLDTAGDDCDDSDDTAYQNLQGYLDEDEDGVGVGDLVDVCTGADLPAGYADVAGDCDDASALVFEELMGYTDLDGDTVVGDASFVLCTDGTLPTGFVDTAGDDCDDFDPYAQDLATHGPACTLQGICVDTEPMLALGQPDMMGIGACVDVDCNGRDSTCAEPLVDQGTACVDAGDCNGGELCIDFAGGTDLTCWAIPNCCNNGALTCSEIVGCLTQCKIDFADPAEQALCMQETCFEGANPVAQHLYRVAQECAAVAGCFAMEDMTGCAMGACQTEFGLCLLDAP